MEMNDNTKDKKIHLWIDITPYHKIKKKGKRKENNRYCTSKIIYLLEGTKKNVILSILSILFKCHQLLAEWSEMRLEYFEGDSYILS